MATSLKPTLWRRKGFQVGVIVGTILPLTVLIIFAKVYRAYDAVPKPLLLAAIPITLLLAWGVLALILVGLPHQGAPFAPYRDILIGLILGAIIGYILLVIWSVYMGLREKARDLTRAYGASDDSERQG